MGGRGLHDLETASLTSVFVSCSLRRRKRKNGRSSRSVSSKKRKRSYGNDRSELRARVLSNNPG